MKKPDIFSYHDYRQYLKDRVAFEKTVQRKFSLRELSSRVKLAPGFLPMVLAGERAVSSEVLERIAEALDLTKDERKFLLNLRTVTESSSQALRLEALEELQKHRGYKDKNPREMEVKRYLSDWHNVAIREMVNLKGFQPDAKWIRSKLRNKISLSEIEKALEFLVVSGFVQKSKDGGLKVVDKKLECTGSIFRLVFSQFHREMLKLASEALETVPFEERSITGLTFPIPMARYPEVFKILDETLDKIDSLSAESKESDSVYHVGISLFPLTNKK